ncbi:polysaccharide biosynthesis/export family protein [Chitinophaga nivalis]|uniref:Polysaccharide biosynthesis/export family protein n=1 Tax=Chitinophaga nivalis TaxID=2991709 RepID=A0ABT3INV4_9BACT|nr:polysaccharide biosynthesis/export family protein [Chitinophaga nivalis]MCW3464658.1 polysaccharide biosynthesis/export family protein [Chitinophaga nivalis]MCW3485651.1 polysaccharide biosynthesis/export family protein [Chitinophaga nivalis]
MSSCSTSKNITYFKDVPDTVKLREITQAAYYTPVIQVDDILQVNIQTLDPAASALLNQQGGSSWPVNGSGPATPAAAGVTGYLVDKDGNVVLPVIGKIPVKGKTTDVVRDEITAKAAQYYRDPVVTVRFSNFKITVLGEVAKPSTYIMPNEKVTLLDAIGVAGDLTIYGKRENVLLIRDKEGKKEFVRFNLNESNLFTSPYFYLRQGDVVYVEPAKSKVANTDMAQVKRISIIASALSLLIVLVSRVNF